MIMISIVVSTFGQTAEFTFESVGHGAALKREVVGYLVETIPAR